MAYTLRTANSQRAVQQALAADRLRRARSLLFEVVLCRAPRRQLKRVPLAGTMTTELFAEWLFRGLGRPYLYLQSHDSTPYLDVLLHACLYNPVYDRQCEGSRANYLFGLISLTGTT